MARNSIVRQTILEGIAARMSMSDIREMIGMKSTGHFYRVVKDMIEEGMVIRTSYGNYQIPEEKTNMASPVENIARKVEVPKYMQGRKPVRLYISRGEDEIDTVIKLELCIGGHWIPTQIYGDLRLYVGEGRPNWSPTQESWDGVKSYRVTLESGRQQEYAHNPDWPFTVDQKG